VGGKFLEKKAKKKKRKRKEKVKSAHKSLPHQSER
jgi:hypothetical protein